MSKKQKRRVASPAVTRETTLKSTSAPAASRYSSSSEFNPDYSHVVKDLKRIGLLAGSFIVILIVLSFFLR
jgi:hypothetical protein